MRSIACNASLAEALPFLMLLSKERKMRSLSLLPASCTALVLAATAAAAQPARTDAGPPPVKALTLMSSAVPSSDLEKSIAFYTKGLGMTLAGRTEMGSVTEAPLSFPGGGPYLMLLHPKTPGTQITPRSALDRMIFAVPDLKALVERLGAAGYQIKGKISENAQYHVSVAQLEDPDGNHIELVQRGQ